MSSERMQHIDQQFFNLHVPSPVITATNEKFWQAAKEGRLLIQVCADCHFGIFYPREACPRCWGQNLDWCPASGDAVVRTYTEVWRPGHPAWTAVVPYWIALVTLEEGPTLTTQLLCPESVRPSLGARCSVRFTTVGDWTLPFFQLDHSETEIQP
ncbi:Zn-ribbon domain-containing OB-fold protein [Rhodococcus opacus]|uniref:Zn-ribbon domain-containing OB-fold protein n=1 Tax=Rhodococcus opacus TaxID=37919 RepID=UPI0022369AE0|nr:zinc ribbon domain-containing protein [Rhodococcus opacus]UZG60321.1 zinc ribbon domain-containing protein [Rhodococcus opacus]